MRIYHNIPALYAYNSLNATNSALQKSIRTLSTGLRINSAADDAAGLAISEKMRSQINGLNMAVRNAQDGISMLQTAEGALSEVHSILQRMRELSVQAANDTLTQQDRQYIQLEIDQLKSEIDRTSTATQFNKKRLLDGSSAGLWSSNDLATKAYIRGSLRQIDRFGQKAAFEGNYKIQINAKPGQAEAMKTDVFTIKHKNVVMGASLNDQAGVSGLRVDNLPAGTYTVKTTSPQRHLAKGTNDLDFSAIGERSMSVRLGSGSAITFSLTENVNNLEGLKDKLDAIDGITATIENDRLKLTSDDGKKITLAEIGLPDEAIKDIMGVGSETESRIELLGKKHSVWDPAALQNKELKVTVEGALAGAQKTITIPGDFSGTVQDLASKMNELLRAQGFSADDITALESDGAIKLVSKTGKITLAGAGREDIMGTGSPTDSTTYLMGGTPPTQFNFKDPAGLGSAPGAPKTMTVEVDGTTTTITLDEVVRDIDTLVAKLNEKFTAAGLDIKAQKDQTGKRLELYSDSKEFKLDGANLNTITGLGAPTTSAPTALESEARLTGKYGFAEGTDLAALLGASVNNARLKNNASVLFEVVSVNKDAKSVTLKATANVLKPDGAVDSKVNDNIVLTEGDFYDLSELLGLGTAGTDPANADGALELQLKAGQTEKFSVGNKFVYNVTKKVAEADAQTVEINGTQTQNWPFKWGDNVADAPLRFGLNASKVTEKELHFRNFYLNSKNGTVYEGDIVLKTNTTKMTAGKTLATFEAAYVGQVAKKDVHLRDLNKFWDSQGRFMLTDPQTINIAQGDGKNTSITLYATDTLAELRSKLNNAIANGLGQARFAVSHANSFVTFVEEGTKQDFGLETVPGTFIIRSMVAGAAGRLSFSGDEDLIKALSLNVVQEAKENAFTASIYDAHNGATVVDKVTVSGNQLIGVIHPNVDVEFDPMANIKVEWNDNLRNFELKKIDTPYETILHLVDNSTVFQVGANEGEDVAIDIGNMSADALGVTRVIVTDRTSAARAISILDNAIAKVSTQRAKIGAFQNSLEHTVTNLTTTGTNLTAAESRIRDADMSQEMLNFTKLQILSQSGTAMLAQANQLPQTVLSLIRG